MNKPLVSVIVTTSKNEEKHAGNCLESVQLQTYPQDSIEVIVVDDDPAGRTKEVALRYTDKVFNKGPERSAKRNFGMLQKARGKYLLYLDADMLLSPVVIEKIVAKLENSDLVALYVPEVVLGSSFWSKIRRFERSFYDATVVDAVRTIRRDIFEKTGGFDLEMTGQEDWDLDKKVRRLGAVALVNDYDFENTHRRLSQFDYRGGNLAKKLLPLSERALIYHNETEFNLRRYLSKKGYYLRSFAVYLQRWGKNDADIKKQIGALYRLFLAFVENGKWRRLVRHPFLAMGMYFLRFLVGFCFLLSKFR